jgi:hypothetical protein
MVESQVSYLAVGRRAAVHGLLRAALAPLLALAFLLSTPAAGLETMFRPACRMACAGTSRCCCRPGGVKRPARAALGGVTSRSATPLLEAAGRARHCPAGCAAITFGTGAPPSAAAGRPARVPPAPVAGPGLRPEPAARGVSAPARLIRPRAPPLVSVGI